MSKKKNKVKIECKINGHKIDISNMLSTLPEKTKSLFMKHSDVNGITTHFKEDGWPLNLEYIFSDFTDAITKTRDLKLHLGLFYIENVYNETGIKLALGIKDGNWFIYCDSELVFYDSTNDKIVVSNNDLYNDLPSTQYKIIGVL